MTKRQQASAKQGPKTIWPARLGPKPDWFDVSPRQAWVLGAIMVFALTFIFIIIPISEQNADCSPSVTSLSGTVSTGTVSVTGNEELAEALKAHVEVENMPWARIVLFKGKYYSASGTWEVPGEKARVSALPCKSESGAMSNMMLRVRRAATESKIVFNELPLLRLP